MRTSDLLEMLSVLNSDERKKFKAFLSSPYYVDPKAQENLLLLCQLSFDEIDHPDNALGDEVTYMRIFPKGDKVKNKLEKLRSELIGYVRAFIRTEYAASRFDGDREHLALANFYLDRKLPNQFLRSYKKLKDWEAKNDKIDWIPIDYTSLLEMKNLYTHYGTMQDYDSLADGFSEFITAINSQFAFYRFYYSLIYMSFMRYRNISQMHEKNQISELLHWAGFDQFTENGIGKALKSILIMETGGCSPDELVPLAQSVYQFIKENDHRLHHNVMRNLQLALHNAIIHANKSKNPELTRIHFLSPRHKTEKMLAPDGPGIHENEFFAALTMAINHRDMEWAQWLTQHANGRVISESDPNAVIHYANACILYDKKEYDQALGILLAHTFDLTILKCMARILEIVILYETGSDILESRIDTTKVFFFREKDIEPQQQIAFNRFIDIMKRLVRPGNTFDPKKIQKIQEEIESNEPLVRREWLRDQASTALKNANRKH